MVRAEQIETLKNRIKDVENIVSSKTVSPSHPLSFVEHPLHGITIPGDIFDTQIIYLLPRMRKH